MLSRFILRSYPTIIEAFLWITPIISFFYFGVVSQFKFNLWFAFFGLILTFIFNAIIYGVILLLIDIHQLLMDIRKTLVKD